MAERALPPTPPRAWWMLGLGVFAQVAATVFISTPAFLIPLLHTERGLSLGHAGLLAAAPSLGLVLTLIGWGALADRWGERWVIVAGLAVTAAGTAVALNADSYLTLGIGFLLGGMGAASPNSASGRVVVGWFPRHRRGLAMGIRQLSQPLGVTIAAVTIPGLAHTGIDAALWVPLGLCAAVAVICAIGIQNPPRSAAPADGTTSGPNPYRGNSFLVRIHAVSVLLVIPQITLSTFGLVWLIADRGWDETAAGLLVGVSQFVGGLGRVVIGVLSDKVGSRVRPLRWVAVGALLAMGVLAGLDALDVGAVAAVYLVATTLSVADNGLAFTAVAEAAGPRWSGRALGTQNTGQYVAAAAVGPVVGWLIGWIGYPIAFAVIAVLPAAAIPLIPTEDRDQELV